MRPLRRDEARQIDRRAIEEFGMSGLVLMENAGRGCVDVLRDLGCRGPVSIVCGKGNNAGDGFVIARHLDLHGVSVKVVLLASPESLRGDAAANYAIIASAGLPLVDVSQSPDQAQLERLLQGSEWIIDAILGTGAVGAPSGPFATAIRAMNAKRARRMAIDVPSGLDCDTAEAADPTFRADHTCTFVSTKVGMTDPKAAPYVGQVHVVPIGVPRRLLEAYA